MRFKILKSGGYTSGGISQAGGTMSGPLLLAADPVDPLEAATKNYVDNSVTNLNAAALLTGTLPVTSFPEITGDASNTSGSNNFSLSTTGVSPGSYVKAAVDAKGRITNGFSLVEADIPDLPWSKITTGKPTTLAGYGITDGLGPSGGTLTGTLSCSVAPTSNLHIANKAYVDTLAANMVGVVNLVTGDLIRKVTSTTPAGYLRCNGGEASKTTYASLYAVIGETYSKRLAPGYGRPWEQQSQQIVNTQVADLVDWFGFTALPAAISYAAVAVTSSRIYIIGGIDTAGTYLSTVYAAKILANGKITPFKAAGNIPVATAYAKAVVTSSRVYFFGGQSGPSTFLANSYYSVMTNGVINGTWNGGVALFEAVSRCGLASYGNYVYLLGGQLGATTYTNRVYRGTIDGTGVITSWDQPSTFTGNTYRQGVLQIADKVYMLGGMSSTTGYRTTIKSATFAADGSSIGTWTDGSSALPIALADPVVYYGSNYVNINGGFTTGGTRNSTHYHIHENNLGTLAWTTSASGGAAMDGAIVINNLGPTGDKISLILGGDTGSGATTNVITIYYGSGEYTGTVQTTGYGLLNYAQSDAGAFVGKDYIYLIGGRTTSGVESTTTMVAYAAKLNADGTIPTNGMLSPALGPWTTNTTPLPANLGDFSLVFTKNRFYVIGGTDSPGNIVSTVYTATLGADGKIGSWSAVTSFPIPIRHASVVNTGSRVYVMGGQTTGNAYIATTYVSVLNTDGTLGTWTSASNPLKTALGGAKVAVTKNNIRIIGGFTGTTYLSEVEVAPLNSDGTIGTWVNEGPLPGPLAFGSCVVTNGAIYMLGGQTTGGTASATQYIGTVASDGSVTGWVTGTNLPIAAYGTQAVIVKDTIYLLSGKSGSTRYRDVYGITITGGSNDYKYYWDGSYVLTDPTKFTLPDYSTKELFGSYTYIKT